MFKKKGSSTNVAIICSLICAALGVYYGLSSKSSTPAVPPVLQAEQYAENAALNTAAAAVDLSPDGLMTSSTSPSPKEAAANVRTSAGTMRFARPATAAGTPAGGHVGTVGFARPMTGTAVDSFSGPSPGTATFAVPD